MEVKCDFLYIETYLKLDDVLLGGSFCCNIRTSSVQHSLASCCVNPPCSLFSANLGNAICSTWSSMMGGIDAPLSIESYRSRNAAVMDWAGTILPAIVTPAVVVDNYEIYIQLYHSVNQTFFLQKPGGF